MRSHTAASTLAMLAVLLYVASPSRALYFHIGEGETKCFIEEVPDETMIEGKYRTQGQNPDGTYAESSPGFGIHVEITDPNEDLIMAKDYEAEGRFVFTAHEPGEHTICLHTNSSRWFSGRTVRVHLELSIGEHANDYETIAKKEKLNALETRIFQLIAQVKDISNEQSYQRQREATFREISVSTNNRVVYWSLIQGVILVLTFIWQVRHLKGFFEAKKLV